MSSHEDPFGYISTQAGDNPAESPCFFLFYKLRVEKSSRVIKNHFFDHFYRFLHHMRSQMVKNGLKRSRMIKNGPKWSKTSKFRENDTEHRI